MHMYKFITSSKLRQIVLGLSCLLLILGISFTASSIPTRKTLQVATGADYPPFEFQGKGGDLQGFDIDLIEAISKAANFEIKFQTLPFDGIIPALQAKKADVAIAAMTINAKRSQAVSFSRPYFRDGLAIVIPADNQDITSLDSLKNKAIAVQIGTTSAQKASEIPGAKIRTFDSAPLTLQELLNRNVDAALIDLPVTLYAIKQNNLKGIKIIDRLITEEYLGIATPKNSPAVDIINKGLTNILENGTYEQIYRKWFDAKPPQLPTSIKFDNSTNPLKSTTVILNALPNLLQGALVTLYLTACSVFLGTIAGALIGIARLSPVKILRWVTKAYIDFFRGTPLLVQIFMVYFGLPALLQGVGINFSLERLTAAVIALSLNSAAYIAEIVRGGIESIEKGQSEAAQSLGLGAVATMRYVILPQALRRMLPPLSNAFITLIKDTSLVAVIGFEELFRRGQLIVAESYRAFEIYAAVALIYLALTLISSQAFSFLERWMNPSHKFSSAVVNSAVLPGKE